MPENPTEAKDWQPCPAGELQRLVMDLKRRSGRKSYGIIASVGVGGLAIVAAAMLWQPFSGDQAAPSIEMTCEEIRSLLNEFAAGNLSDEGLNARIRRHLDECPPCRDAYLDLLARSQTTASYYLRSPRVAHAPYGLRLKRPNTPPIRWSELSRTPL